MRCLGMGLHACTKTSAPAQVVSTMLRKMPQRMAGSMPEVVKAVVAKLASAESSPLITSLLVVLAQLMHVNTSQFLDFLASQPAPGMCPKRVRLGPCTAERQCEEYPHLYTPACWANPTDLHAQQLKTTAVDLPHGQTT